MCICGGEPAAISHLKLARLRILLTRFAIREVETYFNPASVTVRSMATINVASWEHSLSFAICFFAHLSGHCPPGGMRPLFAATDSSFLTCPISLNPSDEVHIVSLDLCASGRFLARIRLFDYYLSSLLPSTEEVPSSQAHSHHSLV